MENEILNGYVYKSSMDGDETIDVFTCQLVDETFGQILDNLLTERNLKPGTWHYAVNGEPTCDLERIAMSIVRGEKVECWYDEQMDYETLVLKRKPYEKSAIDMEVSTTFIEDVK